MSDFEYAGNYEIIESEYHLDPKWKLYFLITEYIGKTYSFPYEKNTGIFIYDDNDRDYDDLSDDYMIEHSFKITHCEYVSDIPEDLESSNINESGTIIDPFKLKMFEKYKSGGCKITKIPSFKGSKHGEYKVTFKNPSNSKNEEISDVKICLVKQTGSIKDLYLNKNQVCQ